MYTSKQKWIIVTPIILSFIYSLFVFFTTIFGSKELAETAQEMLHALTLQYFLLVIITNFIPASILSLLLWQYARGHYQAEKPLQLLMVLGMIGGFFPVVWFYYVFYFSSGILYPVAIALYGLPAAFFIGMLLGFTFGRILLMYYEPR